MYVNEYMCSHHYFKTSLTFEIRFVDAKSKSFIWFSANSHPRQRRLLPHHDHRQPRQIPSVLRKLLLRRKQIRSGRSLNRLDRIRNHRYRTHIITITIITYLRRLPILSASLQYMPQLRNSSSSRLHKLWRNKIMLRMGFRRPNPQGRVHQRPQTANNQLRQMDIPHQASTRRLSPIRFRQSGMKESDLMASAGP
jgi:hypothetical protein